MKPIKVFWQLSDPYRMGMRFLLFLEVVFLAFRSAYAGTPSCIAETIRANLQGALFLHRLNPRLYKAPMVERAESILMQLGEKNPKDVQKKIAAWLSVVEKTHLSRQGEPQVLDRLKDYYYREHVISEQNFPESYFKLQIKIAREQGHGAVWISPKQRAELIQNAIEDQKKSLDSWIEYLTSKNALYPMWAKVWAFNGMTRIDKIDAKTGHALIRSSKTVAPFIDLNQGALSLSIEAVEKMLHAKHKGSKYKVIEENSELRELVQGGNFGKIYGFYVRELAKNTIDPKVTEGAWVKYPWSSDPKPLVQSLLCKNTGWCTMSESTAKRQLQKGDFYVYYSNDSLGRPKNPRVAIRMQENKIVEVRGIGPSQELDPIIGNTEILDQKLKEFGAEGERYRKRSTDRKLLAQVEQKQEALEELTESELRFLYEIDAKIEGFGDVADPRIKEIREKRNIRQDLSKVYHVNNPEELAVTKEEALSGTRRVYFGDLEFFSLKSAEGLKFPEELHGNLNLGGLTSSEGLKLPNVIYGGLWLSGLKSAKGLVLPKVIHSDLELGGLTSAVGLKLPEELHGTLWLGGLTSAEGLILPKVMPGSLWLSSLKSAEGLKLPNAMHGDLTLSGLKSAEGLKLPNLIQGDLWLDGLESAEGLVLPDVIQGKLVLSSLKSAVGLKLPKKFKNQIVLPEGLEPQWIN